MSRAFDTGVLPGRRRFGNFYCNRRSPRDTLDLADATPSSSSSTTHTLILASDCTLYEAPMPPDLNSLSPQNPSSCSPSRNRDGQPPFGDLVQPHPPQYQPPPPHASARSPLTSTHAARFSVSEQHRSANDPGHVPAPERLGTVGHAIRTASPSSVGGSPAAIGDPHHHHRTPSLGELHQELEQEQEAQVV